jgi:hypothetical protein
MSWVSGLSLYLWFNLWRASFLLSQLSGSDPGSEEGMVGTGVFGEVMGRPEELGEAKENAGL